MNREDLTLGMIDNMCHLTASEKIIQAAAFAARAGHTDRTVHRFVTALVMTDSLSPRKWWEDLLGRVARLEREEAEETHIPHSPGCPPIKHRH